MSLPLALGSPSSSAHATGRGGGGALAGTIFPGSYPLRPPLQQVLLRSCHERRRDAGRGFGSGVGVWKAEEKEPKASICRASRPAASAAAGMTGGVPPPQGWWYSRGGGVHGYGKARGDRIVCSATGLDYETLQWISSISCLVLMLAKGTAIQRAFLAPLFALQAPINVVSWIKGEYGNWTAFLALLVRLFYFIPGELDLPFLTLLLVIVSPHQTMNVRGTKTGAIISLIIAGYVLFQHFSRAGSLQKAFDQGSVVATLAVICIVIVPCLFLF